MVDPSAPERLVAAHHLEEVTLELPFWRYTEAFLDDPWCFLLDSQLDPERLGQASFLGGDPLLIHHARRVPGAGPGEGAQLTVTELRTFDGQRLGTPRVTRRVGDPFADLRALFARLAIAREDYARTPVPLLGGAVGWFGYASAYFIEKLPDAGLDDLQLPDSYWMFVDAVLARDERSGRSYVTALGWGPDAATAEARAAAAGARLRERIARYERAPRPAWSGPPAHARPHLLALNARSDERRYAGLVERAQERILAGDVFEVCITHRLDAPYRHHPWDVYRELRRTNPAPFACYVQTPEATVVSASPERFLRLGPDRVAESRPIKGTRPRGATPDADRALAEELATNTKDRAENVMIVDLVRNDLGRVCEIGSVHVPELMIVERYATVLQLVSTVRGMLRRDRDGFDLLRACFPGGSMTGAPKVEAMKIIDALEDTKRGIYSGSIGYLDYSGTFDLNIVIRTLVIKDRRAWFSVGGAVVADSDPVAEYREAEDKARALIRALENVERVHAS